MDALEALLRLPMLRLPMQRAYRIDLGFDLAGVDAAVRPPTPAARRPAPLAATDWPLAALVEQGLPLVRRPYDRWALQLGCDGDRVVDTLAAGSATARSSASAPSCATTSSASTPTP